MQGHQERANADLAEIGVSLQEKNDENERVAREHASIVRELRSLCVSVALVWRDRK